MIKIAINGFGRIGRLALRAILEKHAEEAEVVAINTSGNVGADGWAYFFKYDTAYGKFSKEISADGENIIVEQKTYPVLAIREPRELPWGELNVDVVIESTGKFTDYDGALSHLSAGAKKVVISAPAKGENIPTYIIGVNNEKYHGEKIISNGSCTTNCVAPICKIMTEKFGVLKASMTTIHSYTSDQELQDGSHKDWRRGRAAAQNIVPTTTGAAEAVIATLPELGGIFEATAIRVPSLTGSLSDLSFLVNQKTTSEEVNLVFSEIAESAYYRDIIAVTTEPVVSSDIVGNSHSAIVDLNLTKVVAGDLVKIIAWYDNEWGYVERLVEQAIIIGSGDGQTN